MKMEKRVRAVFRTTIFGITMRRRKGLLIGLTVKEMEIIEITRKSRPARVRVMRVSDLDVSKCSSKFVEHNFPGDMVIYVRCYEDGSFDLRGKKEEYRIIVPDNKKIKSMSKIELNEKELPDDYPVYGDYLYVCDGDIVRCDLMSGTVADLKRDLRGHYKKEAKVIKNCDIIGRKKRLEEEKQS